MENSRFPVYAANVPVRHEPSLALVHEAGMQFLRNASPHQFFDDVLGIACDIAGAAGGAIHLVEREHEWRVVAQRGADRDVLRLLDDIVDEPTLTALRSRRLRIAVDDLRTWPLSAESRQVIVEHNILAWECVPLVSHEGDPMGVLSLYFSAPHRSSADTLKAIERVMRHAADFIERGDATQTLQSLCDRERDGRARAEASCQSKDALFATMAHELRQPLSAIIAGLDLQVRTSNAEHRQRATHIVREQLAHLTRLIENLSEASTLARGGVPLHLETVDLCAIVRLEWEATAAHFAARRHQATLEAPADALWVFADATRLKQVFSNLLMNAAKYTPADGEIRATLAVDGTQAIFRLCDTGTGIPPHELERIFEPFERASEDETSASVGLGLSIVRQLVRMHGGTVRASSDGEGKGSQFTVVLPLLGPGIWLPPR